MAVVVFFFSAVFLQNFTSPRHYMHFSDTRYIVKEILAG